MDDQTLEPDAVRKAATPSVPSSDAVARAEADVLVQEMAKSYGGMLAFYEKHYGLDRKGALARMQDSIVTPEEKLRALAEDAPDQLSWYDFHAVMEISPECVGARWTRLKEQAREELAGGQRAASASRDSSPWDRARHLAIREGFIDEWDPRGGIELALIDQMALSFSSHLRWLEHFDWLSRADVRHRESEIDRKGEYKEPRTTMQTYEDKALRRAEQFQRVFLRSLRALRDLRRYSSQVTIHNRGQVNIGKKQVNVSGIE